MDKIAFLKHSFLLYMGAGTVAVGWSVLIKKKLSQVAQFFIVSLASFFIFLAYIFWIEPNWIEVHKVKIHDPALAKSLQGVKVVQISDIHIQNGLGFREHDLIKKVNSLKPDIIFMTGDYFDDLNQLEYAKKLIHSLKAKMGIWGVPGNTDHISIENGKSISNELTSEKVRILVNEAERIQTAPGKYFWIVGVDDPVYGHAKLPRAIGPVPPGEPCVLLAHSPDIFESAVRERVNLVLVGHTHGGQIGIPLLVRLSDYAYRGPYMRGFYKKGRTQLYVNRGIGMKTLPIRFLCRPEISLIEVES